jgi:hypothetical protein
MNWLPIYVIVFRRQDFCQTWLYIWVTRRVSYKRQEQIVFREHRRSLPVFLVGYLYLIFFVLCAVFLFCILCTILYVSSVSPCFQKLGSCCSFCPLVWLYVLSSVLCFPLRFPYKKRCSVRVFPQLFDGGLMYYLCYLCLF